MARISHAWPRSVLMLGLLVLGTNGAFPTECPNDDSGKATHIAHESDCTKFYVCNGGQKVPRQCPALNEDGERLHFNPESQICDWPSNVNCPSLGPSMPVQLSAFEAEIPTRCPKSDLKNETVHLAHENDCTKYYKCSHQKKWPMECPFYEKGKRLYFNPKTQVCDWPFNVDCPLPSLRMLSSADHSEYPIECPKFDSPDQSIQLPHETECTSYYSCSGGSKHLMKCPVYNENGDRLQFNPKIHGCDWPFNVNCEKPQAGPSARTRYWDQCLDPIPTECPEEDSEDCTVHLEDKTDCTKFYKCSGGRAVPKECPLMPNGRRLYFNRELQVCDWPWNVDCDASGNSSPATTPKVTTPKVTTPKVTTPKVTTPKVTTPKVTTPKVTTPKVTTPKVTTPEVTTPKVTTTTFPTEKDGCLANCPDNDPPNKITAWPHSDCRKWCRCQNTKHRVVSCPADLHFSPTLRICVDPKIAGCKSSKHSQSSGASNVQDEALMNILGYTKRLSC